MPETHWAPLRSRTPHSLWRKLAFCGVLVTALGSCAVQPPETSPPAAFAMETGADVFSIGYEGIAELYVEPVPMPSIALAALDGVAALDPNIAFVRRGDSLIVTDGGAPFAKFTVPGDDTPYDWARLTSAGMEAARSRSRILNDATADRLYEAAFDAITSKLDRFSRYHNAAETLSSKSARNGYTGIGITIADQNDAVIITAVFHDAPAHDAGLRAGDHITAVNGRPAIGLAMVDVAELLRGPNGTTVNVEVDRDGTAYSYEVERRRVIEDTVSFAALDGIAYINIRSFNSDTANALSRALTEAKGVLGDDLPGIVLDLRQNRGGTLDEAVEVADLFVDDGILLETQGRHNRSQHRYDAAMRNTETKAPMAVLIDSGSASAAEVVAAALQDSGRALVIGARSYGKGTVQRVIDLPPISTELILTWARMHAPSGYTLADFGVFPSICTPDYSDNPDISAAALQSGELRLSETMQKRLNVRHMSAADQETLKDWCRANHPPSMEDSDTRLAIRLLSDRQLFRLAFHASRVALGESPAETN